MASKIRIAVIGFCGIIMNCDMPQIKSEHFEPDQAVLVTEINEIFAKERSRDEEGLLLHWEPCEPQYTDDSGPVRRARRTIQYRLAPPPPENLGCRFKLHKGYGSEGRFVDALCAVRRNGVTKNEILGLIAIYPSKWVGCRRHYILYTYRPRNF